MFDDATMHPLLAHNSVADMHHLDGMTGYGTAGNLDSAGDSSYADSNLLHEEFSEPVSGYGILPEVNDSSMPRQQSGAPEQRKGGGSQRRHYAVEKRYRSTLNGKYAALARALSSEATQRICRTDSADWAVKSHPPAVAGTLQRKTATLSSAIDTMEVLCRCCRREAAKLEQLQRSVQEMRHRMQQVLESNPPTRSESSPEERQQQREQGPRQLLSPSQRPHSQQQHLQTPQSLGQHGGMPRYNLASVENSASMLDLGQQQGG
ncbi:uncharacterized protein PG998_006648 [Apiospora kogelbergensis]|uniref:uncharacterized protein n=1 Tax=Apiospora kogelbergensis TaxID=1337665 RepID=UPI00312D0753